MREGDQMTDEKAPEGAPSSDADATAPQSTGGWVPPPDAAAAPPPAWSPPTPDAAATPPPAASPAPLAPLVSSTPPPAVPPPAYTPQPAVAWQAAPAVAVASGRSGLAAGAGIGLLVFGILLLLIGLLFFAVAGMVGGLAGSGGFGDIPGMPPGFEGAIGGFVVVFGVIVILYSLLYIVGGIGVLRSRNWGRVIGIVVGIITGLLMLSGVTTPSATGDQSSLIFSLILLALHVYIVVALAFFWRSKSATA
jgi:hypothetical protein